MTHRTLTLTCDHCGAIARRHLGDPEHDPTVTRAWHADLAAEGWSLGEHDTCPACTKADAKPVDLIPVQENLA
jgi:hypothetical protein